MARRTRSPETRLLELVGDVYGFDDVEEFRSGILGPLRRAVPADWASYNEVGDGPGQAWVAVDPPATAADFERFGRYAHEHPLVIAMRDSRDGRPTRISDHLSTREFHRLPIYRGFFGPFGVEHQVALTLPAAPPTVIGIALSRRHRDFTDEECWLLGQARPHLIQAYRSLLLAATREATLAALEHGLEATGALVAVVRRDGRVTSATPAAWRVLHDRLGVDPGTARLPAETVARLAAPRAAGAPLVFGAGEDACLVRVLPGGGDGSTDVLLLEAGTGQMSIAALRSLGLTPREAEALRWIALGRTSADAAQVMGASRRTVDKHLQNAYAKLGVHSRSEASATAWAAVGITSAESA